MCLQEANHYGARGGAGAAGRWAGSAWLGFDSANQTNDRNQPSLTPADELAAALRPLGLTGYFLPKHPSPTERFGCPPDGTALFYRPSRLAPAPGGRGLRGAQYARTDGSGGAMTQGYVIGTLRDGEAGGRAVVVAGTHLKAKEGAPNDETRRQQVRA